MKRFISAVVLPAFAASLALAAPSLSRSAFPDHRTIAARHPQSDAVVLYDSLVVSMDEGGRITKRRHRAAMLFTDNAINRYGDPRILFDADREKLRVLTARAHMRDGSAVDAKSNSLNRTTPFAVDLAPDYTNWQEMVVTHVGIEKGCVAELEYEIAGLEPSPWLGGVEIFSSEDPVELRVLVVKPPAGTELARLGMNGAPEAARSDGAWIWTVRDIPGRTAFDGGVWGGDYLPAVCYGTAPGWTVALSGIADDLASSSAAVPAAEGPVREATKDLATDEERILAVHRLALESVRSVRAPFALLASPPRSAARIYDTGYASPLDRAVLLAAMLRRAGYDPCPVLVSAGRVALEDAPTVLELFGAVWIEVHAADAGRMLLDPCSPYERDASFALAGKWLANLGCGGPAPARGEPRLMAAPERPAESRSSLDLKLVPGDGGALAGTGRVDLRGVYSPYYSIRSGTSVEKYVGDRVTRLFGGAELVSCNPLSLDRTGTEIEFAFTVKLPEQKPGERVYLSLPRAFDSAASGIDRVRTERSACSDAVLLEPGTLAVSCSIALPDGWRLVALPPPASVRNEIGVASVTTEEPSGETSRAVRVELSLERDLVAPPLYGRLRSLAAVLADNLIVIEKE